MEEDTPQILSSEEVLATMRQIFFKVLSGESYTEENPQRLSTEYCRAEDVEKAKTVISQELRAKVVEQVVDSIAQKNQRLTADDLHALRGQLLEAMGRLLEY